MPQKISWVLIDIGSTLVNDDPAMLMFYGKMLARIRERDPDFTFERLMQERERTILDRASTRPWAAVAHQYLGEDGWRTLLADFLVESDSRYTHYNTPLPGVTEMLATLSDRYHLVVAANQGLGCRAGLEELDWLKYFDFIWISDEVKMRKPSREFFEGLLAKAGCRPEDAVMIGDRIDADIRPARQMGMKAIHAQVNPGLPETFESPEARLYRESHGRVRLGNMPPTDELEQADAVVTSIADIPAAVERVQML